MPFWPFKNEFLLQKCQKFAIFYFYVQNSHENESFWSFLQLFQVKLKKFEVFVNVRVQSGDFFYFWTSDTKFQSKQNDTISNEFGFGMTKKLFFVLFHDFESKFNGKMRLRMVFESYEKWTFLVERLETIPRFWLVLGVIKAVRSHCMNMVSIVAVIIEIYQMMKDEFSSL